MTTETKQLELVMEVIRNEMEIIKMEMEYMEENPEYKQDAGDLDVLEARLGLLVDWYYAQQDKLDGKPS